MEKSRRDVDGGFNMALKKRKNINNNNNNDNNNNKINKYVINMININK